jgi:hypothetical protein
MRFSIRWLLAVTAYIALARGPIRPDRVVYQNTATGLVPDLRTSNGVVTLVAGLIGCLIGLLAYRHASGS